MEVHHHPNVKNKKFKEYFLEFIMIFLAVTLGFFAENFLELISDHHQEKEYIKSMVADLKIDTANIAETIMVNKQFIKYSDSLFALLDRSNYNQQEIKKIYRLAILNCAQFEIVNFSKRTLSELKNNGGARLIKNIAVSDSITNYDLTVETSEGQAGVYTKYTYEALDLFGKLFDTRSIRKLGGWTAFLNEETFFRDYPGELHFLANDSLPLRQFANLVFLRQGSIQLYLIVLEKHREQGIRLIKFLKKEYDLENE